MHLMSTPKDIVHPGQIRPLKVKNAALITLRQHQDARGPIAIIGQGDAPLPFIPNRLFLTYDVSDATRGEHAHRRCEQLLLCVHGEVTVLLDDGTHAEEITLRSPTEAVFIPAMVWAAQFAYSPNAVVLVAASLPYDSEDYLRNKADWLAELNAPSLRCE